MGLGCSGVKLGLCGHSGGGGVQGIGSLGSMSESGLKYKSAFFFQ